MEIIPNIDTEALQEAANAAALKGAIDVIDKFYNGYDSPYKKQLKEDLEANGVNIHFGLPDIAGLINVALGAEIDRLANNAIAATYLPLVREVLVRVEGTVSFSNILKKFVQENTAYDYEEFGIDVQENERHKWLTVRLERGSYHLEFTLHAHNEKEVGDQYTLLSLPRLGRDSERKMTLFLDDVGKVEMPFVPDLIRDHFVAYLACLVLNQSVIIMDQDYFDRDWFDTCHCH